MTQFAYSSGPDGLTIRPDLSEKLGFNERDDLDYPHPCGRPSYISCPHLSCMFPTQLRELDDELINGMTRGQLGAFHGFLAYVAKEPDNQLYTASDISQALADWAAYDRHRWAEYLEDMRYPGDAAE